MKLEFENEEIKKFDFEKIVNSEEFEKFKMNKNAAGDSNDSKSFNKFTEKFEDGSFTC